MGCQSSRNITIEDQCNSNNKAQSDKVSYFTELQIDCIRSTWPLVSKNKIKFGCDIFAEIFTMEPKIMDMFSFGQVYST